MVLDGRVLDSKENPFKMEVRLNFFVLENILFSSISFKKLQRIVSEKPSGVCILLSHI